MHDQLAQQPIKRRASLNTQQSDEIEDLVGDKKYYVTRTPNSTRRYYDTRGNQVIQRGNQRIVIHEEPPPRKRHFHWLLWVGVVMFIAIGGMWAVNNIDLWWINQENTWNYGMPRTYQTDAVVGHSDSSVHPSHFIALNLDGHIQIIEIPGGDPSHEHVYIGPTIFSANPELVPVTVSFQDVNGDGKPDMLIHIQGQTIVFLNDGKQFTASK